MLNELIKSVWAMYGDQSHICAIANRLIKSDFKMPVSARAGDPSFKRSGAVAVIDVVGPIVKDGGPWAEYFGLASSARITRAIHESDADDSIEKIVLNIDSPGGSVDGMFEAGDAVAQAGKPVVAHVSGVMASAAYYIGARATAIYANRMDLIGSIGVRMTLFDYSAMFEKEGIKAIPIDTGKFKSAGEMGTEITDDQIEDFQRVVDGYFSDFREVVMAGRKMGAKQWKAVSDGRVWNAPEAIDLGLIDGIKSIDETINEQTKPAKKGKALAMRELELMQLRANSKT